MTRTTITTSRRWVVKVGSSLVTAAGRGLDAEAIGDWCTQIANLHKAGRQIVLVSSGAVAEGMARLGLARRPTQLPELQAAAAVGQMGLIHAYEMAFARHGLRAAQILLTHDDVTNRERYLNARSALQALLGFGVIPIVNENDTVATEEIRVGDNDTLGALTCNLIEAEVLVILTDQEGLYDRDPRVEQNATLVSERKVTDPDLVAMAGEGRGMLGRGGMKTKLTAANWAARSGAATIIAHGRLPQVLERIAGGEALGTLLTPGQGVMAARKRWIAHQLQARGRVYVDAGAAAVLRGKGRSLLPVGVLRVEGDFQRGDLVVCLDPEGREIARGLTNYAADEAVRIVGYPSAELNARLGYLGEAELIHRDNLVLTG
jgi:glutamate 5-kinase